MTPQLFADLKVSKELAKALDRLGLEEASPAQAAAISAVNGRRSAVIAAPPASGRKLALAMAAVELADPAAKHLELLILTPSRESALHLATAIRSLTSGRKGLGCAVVVAGRSPEHQAARLGEKPTILIGTPGCVRSLLTDGAVSRETLKAVLLDGVDELLEMGNGEDLEAVLAGGREDRTVIALATFISPEVESLAGAHCPDADRVVAPAPGSPPALTWYDVEPRGRLTALSLLADRHQVQRGLIFTKSPSTASELAGQLAAAGYPSEAVLIDLTAAARERILKKFRSGDLTFLVTTDAGLRGVATEPADVVVHCDWPLDDGSLAVRQAGLRPGGQGFALASGRQILRARAFSRRGSPSRMGRLPVLAEGPESRLQASVARLRDALSVRNPAVCRTIVDILIADGFEPAVIAGAAIRLLGSPEVPPQAVPAPLPRPAAREVTAPAPARDRGRDRDRDRDRPSRAPAVMPVEDLPHESAAPVEEPADWSPGVSSTPSEEPSAMPVAEGGETGGYEETGYTGGAYSADNGYVITDNVSEDGVVYPPGANFGDESTPDYGFGGGGGEQRREGRRERGGRGRNRGGDGGGATAPGMRRLWLNVGRMDRIQPKDIVGCILGETGIPPVSIGRVQLFERHSLVDISVSFENQIIDALNRTTVRGRKLKAKVAAY